MSSEDLISLAKGAADQAIAEAETRTWEGVANAERAYTLSHQILHDDHFTSVILLDQLVAQMLIAGLTAYERVGSEMARADQRVAALFTQCEEKCRDALGGSDAG